MRILHSTSLVINILNYSPLSKNNAPERYFLFILWFCNMDTRISKSEKGKNRLRSDKLLWCIKPFKTRYVILSPFSPFAILSHPPSPSWLISMPPSSLRLPPFCASPQDLPSVFPLRILCLVVCTWSVLIVYCCVCSTNLEERRCVVFIISKTWSSAW